ncbi:MAG: single-stranded DNA-binding protein [Desulfobacterales bacterium]|jgi:single-strand selective monofunctional uracil DNA glycosylase|nr:single-stranded DNA-binding protein [Desulfobacterales bacterium]
MAFETIIAKLVKAVSALSFSLPVTHVYNPLVYARAPHEHYLKRYGRAPREVLLLGMNPGPWGMVQTGVPFGEVAAVTEWLGIRAPVNQPASMHPRRPVEGFACKRSEVSGRRLWGWAKKEFNTPDLFFSRFFVANYCPLVFMAESGKNITPNHLPKSEREPLLAICDRALRETAAYFSPRYVIGIGEFAAQRAAIALSDTKITVGKITHPSPANPKANRGWEKIISEEFRAIGIIRD